MFSFDFVVSPQLASALVFLTLMVGLLVTIWLHFRWLREARLPPVERAIEPLQKRFSRHRQLIAQYGLRDWLKCQVRQFRQLRRFRLEMKNVVNQTPKNKMNVNQHRQLQQEDHRLSMVQGGISNLLTELCGELNVTIMASTHWQNSESPDVFTRKIDAMQSVLNLIETARDEIEALERGS